jgi:hypothetical protein
METSQRDRQQALQSPSDYSMATPGAPAREQREAREEQPPRVSRLDAPGEEDLAELVKRRRLVEGMLLWLSRLRIGSRLSRRSSRRTVQALVTERQLIGPQPATAMATYAETVVRGIATRAADDILDQTHLRLSRHARRTDRLRARRATLRDRVNGIPGEHVRHVDGGKRTVREARRDRDALQAQISGQRGRGSRKHERLSGWFGRLPRVVLVFDLFLLLYFFSGITDVDWGAPLSMPLAFASGLAAMVTAASYGCLAFAGHRLRRYKDDSGSVPVRDLDWLSRLVAGAAALGVVLLAVLMFVRMRSETLLALGPRSSVTAFVIALALAGVSALANVLVIAVHAFDGSEETDRLRALSTAVGRAYARSDRMNRRANRLDHVIATRVRRAQRVAVRGTSRAGRPLGTADRIIDTARIPAQRDRSQHEATCDPNVHDGVTGYRQGEPALHADERSLHLALEHVDTDLPSETRPGKPGREN